MRLLQVSNWRQIWWVWRSWLTRQIVVLESEGSSPSTHPFHTACGLRENRRGRAGVLFLYFFHAFFLFSFYVRKLNPVVKYFCSGTVHGSGWSTDRNDPQKRTIHGTEWSWAIAKWLRQWSAKPWFSSVQIWVYTPGHMCIKASGGWWFSPLINHPGGREYN